MSIESTPAVRTRPPVVTVVAMAAAVIIFVGIAASGKTSWEHYSRWGYLPTERILSGAFWGLITSAFVHLEVWHIALNLYWLWALGSIMERNVGSPRFLLFVLSSAFVSSGMELLTGSAGIGLSGVVYAVFGFMWISRDRYPDFARIVTERVANLFFVWLFICFPATWLKIMNVGNMAHLGGLLFGMAVASVFVLKYRLVLTELGLAALIGGSILSLFWAPWSEEWVSAKAYNADLNRDYPAAVRYYRRAIDLGADPKWAWHNLAAVYGNMRDYAGYAEALAHLREVDPAGAREVESDFGPAGEATKSEDK